MAVAISRSSQSSLLLSRLFGAYHQCPFMSYLVRQGPYALRGTDPGRRRLTRHHHHRSLRLRTPASSICEGLLRMGCSVLMMRAAGLAAILIYRFYQPTLSAPSTSYPPHACPNSYHTGSSPASHQRCYDTVILDILKHYVRSQVRTTLLLLFILPQTCHFSVASLGAASCSVGSEGWCRCLPACTGSVLTASTLFYFGGHENWDPY